VGGTAVMGTKHEYRLSMPALAIISKRILELLLAIRGSAQGSRIVP